MKALIDTNVVLDALMSREPWREEAEKVLLASAEGKLEGYITASAATDVFYIVRKQLGGSSDARSAMRHLFQVVRILEVSGADCLAALDLASPDFEDALQAAAAIRAGLDCVITRDQAGFRGAGIRVVKPSEALAGV
jgi:predicted nucleic acid-binding protein